MNFGIISAFAAMFISGLGAGVYLIMNDHPWFGLFVLFITANIKVTTGGDKDGEK